MNDSNKTPNQHPGQNHRSAPSGRNEKPNDRDEKPGSRDEKHSFLDVLKSTLSAALGVQSQKNREKDFQHGSLKVFLAAGVIFTTIFILVVMTVVKLALRDTGL